VRLESLRGSERRVVRIVGMVGLELDETQILLMARSVVLNTRPNIGLDAKLIAPADLLPPAPWL